MEIMMMGYTGKCLIKPSSWDNPYLVLLSSYSVSVGMNVLKSEAMRGQFRWSRGYRRFTDSAVRDCPGYEIAVSLELIPKVMGMLMTSMASDSFREPYDLFFTDDSNGLSFRFDGCRISSFSFQVGENSAATASLSFSYFKQDFVLSTSSYDLYANNPLLEPSSEDEDQSESGFSHPLAGESLMPYYSFGVEYDSFNESDLTSLSFSFSHSITPKYGCMGMVSERNAPVPMRCIFSVPTVSYELSYVMHDPIARNDYVIDSNRILDSVYDPMVEDDGGTAGDSKLLVIKYRDPISDDFPTPGYSMELLCSNCYPESYVPEVGTSGGVNSVSISGQVHGGLYYSESVPSA